MIRRLPTGSRQDRALRLSTGLWVICAFVWAGSHHLDVTNNSYFADPWLFNCRNDAGQRAIWKAEQRAIRFALTQGTTVVAAEGNESSDLSNPTIDTGARTTAHRSPET